MVTSDIVFCLLVIEKTVKGITFYNDSISTIPQASIAAIQALKKVNTVILGGFDRGIDYQSLIDFLALSEVEHIIFTGNAGKRMLELSRNLKNKQLFFRNTYPEIVSLAKECTKKGSICLLSPAAASYDSFRNFEHRGNTFREFVLLFIRFCISFFPKKKGENNNFLVPLIH